MFKDQGIREARHVFDIILRQIEVDVVGDERGTVPVLLKQTSVHNFTSRLSYRMLQST